MKKLSRSILLLAFLGAASLACAAVPPMDVTVSNSTGKLLFKGRTDAKGLFTTKSLAPGNYVVQFNSKSAKGGPYEVVVAAGKKKFAADSVPASKFSKGGVAMRVEVTKAMSLTGQVADAGQAMASSQSSTKGNAKVKYVNGKKLVWVPGELGSNLGGRWVDANSAEGRHVVNVSQEGVREFQDRSQAAPPPSGR